MGEVYRARLAPRWATGAPVMELVERPTLAERIQKPSKVKLRDMELTADTILTLEEEPAAWRRK
jgi:hypothetical protein